MESNDKKMDTWVSEMMARMSPRERIAQLLHVPAWSNRDDAHEEALLTLVQKYNIGGIIFFQGTARKQAKMTNTLQAASKVPLFISIDGEWGLAMRLAEMLRFPYAATLGAIEDDDLIFACGKAIGEQCKRLGIHINYTPCVDINTEPDNPVIGFRAFGTTPQRVAQKAIAFMQGQRAAGVMAVAKHFPGHGDTVVDSHVDLPVVKHDMTRFREWEWYPYREVIAAGVEGVMVAHLAVPTLEPKAIPASLSHQVIHQFLKKELGFQGLVFTDALNMKGATASYKASVGDVLAVQAGHDILLYVEDVPQAIAHIEEAVRQGKISQQEIDLRVIKQLKAKYRAGCANQKPILLDGLEKELNPPTTERLIQHLFDHAVSLLVDKSAMLPLIDLKSTAFLVYSAVKHPIWQQKFPQGHFIYLSDTPEIEKKDDLLKKLNNFDRIVCIVHGLSQKASLHFGLDDQLAENLLDVFLIKPTLLILPANPYVRFKLPHEKAAAVLIGFEDRQESWESLAKVMAGEQDALGQLKQNI